MKVLYALLGAACVLAVADAFCSDYTDCATCIATNDTNDGQCYYCPDQGATGRCAYANESDTCAVPVSEHGDPIGPNGTCPTTTVGPSTTAGPTTAPPAEPCSVHTDCESCAGTTEGTETCFWCNPGCYDGSSPECTGDPLDDPSACPTDPPMMSTEAPEPCSMHDNNCEQCAGADVSGSTCNYCPTNGLCISDDVCDTAVLSMSDNCPTPVPTTTAAPTAEPDSCFATFSNCIECAGKTATNGDECHWCGLCGDEAECAMRALEAVTADECATVALAVGAMFTVAVFDDTAFDIDLGGGDEVYVVIEGAICASFSGSEFYCTDGEEPVAFKVTSGDDVDGVIVRLEGGAVSTMIELSVAATAPDGVEEVSVAAIIAGEASSLGHSGSAPAVLLAVALCALAVVLAHM